MTASAPPPVLVFGSGLTVLGVLRSLARAGIPSYVVADEPDFVVESRWFRPAPAPDGVSAGDDLGTYLRRVPLERAVLMPCSDAWLTRVARLDACLTDRFPSGIAASAVLETLVDKGCFADAARASGVPGPRTLALNGLADVAAVPEGWLAGGVLKPRRSQEFFQRFGVKAFRLRDRDDALRRFEQIEPTGLGMLLQEYVPGPPSHHVFVDGFAGCGGRLEAVFARRRLRMHPPDFGNSTYMVSVGRHDVAEAVEAAEAVLRHVGYHGAFSAEFKYDARDRRFKILEVNARPWWYVEFAARCGVNVCAMAYRRALGLPAEGPPSYRVGRRCVYPYYDFGACRELWRNGRLSLGSWLRSWLTAEQPVFRWSDPVPATLGTVRGVARVLRRKAAQFPASSPAARHDGP
jgi:D-aspartate ligase